MAIPLFNVPPLAMPNFVGEYADEFLRWNGFFDKRIKESDALGLSKSGEKGVRFGGAFGSVDFEDTTEGVLLGGGIVFRWRSGVRLLRAG